ncbi:MAG: pyridoxal phosphate-dependent aminotransferase [Salibacteraceae bacterium]
MRVSEMAENLIPSEIIKLGGEIREKIAAGEQIYNFTIGDFNPAIFPIPEELKSAIIEAYQNNETNYPAANGQLELRQSVSRFLHTRGGLEYSEDQLLVAGGSRPLIYAVYRTLVDPEDKVIYPVPSWNNNHYCHLSGAKGIPITARAEDNFMPTAASIAPHVSGATLIALCSPLNPTGTAFSRTQLEAICRLVLDENRKRKETDKPLYLLFDQVYWTLTHDDNLHFDPVSLFPEMKDYTLYIDGLSKAFAATGVRVGWAFGPRKVMDKMKAILGHVGAWAPRAEQMAVAQFLQQDAALDRFLEDFTKKLHERLHGFYQGFTQLKSEGFAVDAIAPQGGIYLTVKFELIGKTTPDGKKLTTALDVTQFLLNTAHLAIVPFSAFGASRNNPWFRISVGTAKIEDIEQVLLNVKQALSQLQ